MRKREYSIKVYLGDEEKEVLEALSIKAKKSKNEVIRDLILVGRVTEDILLSKKYVLFRKALNKYTEHIKNAFTNLNLITKYIYMADYFDSDKFDNVLDEIKKRNEELKDFKQRMNEILEKA